ncbi:unnamed protein product [Adineta steineri]|uniref:Uncharacterized protein n=1 Tax=Adineta steineri TaxID=433720 RepID=A0A819MUQ3_9BILA|nr:unnamed protein product [Adineta steineri]CAF3986275.1 unnamed protein product [Adineta steineri]
MRRVLSFTTDTHLLCSPAKQPKMEMTGQEIISIPRSYQTELVEQAKAKNLIVCLPTGSGKTYIAVMLIKEMANEIRKSIDNGGKRTIFLVKTVALVEQQSDYIYIHTGLKVGRYYGELGVDLWDKTRWMNEFKQHQVLVFTAKVFLDLVDHNYFSLYKVNLLIFDECHHSTGENSYAALMRRHYDICDDPPRILGLTASISAKKLKLNQLSKVAKDLEETYRARIASGSDREESVRYGTSANVEHIICSSYKKYITDHWENVAIAFDMIESIVEDLKPYLKDKKEEREQHERDLSEAIINTDYLGENVIDYNTLSIDYTIFLQSEYVNIPQLKKYLEQLIHVGYELGLYGLFIATKALQKALKLSQSLDRMIDSREKQIFDDAIRRIDCLVDDILPGLIDFHRHQNNILFSSKVLKLFERIMNDVTAKNLSRCIIFVERIYTASTLTKVLTELRKILSPSSDNQLKIKYVTGPRANVGDVKMNAKYLRHVIKEFRDGDINVLIATAVVEEGLDIPKCNLVFRFNKPVNFASYMQSKGRARAKDNASYVLLIDGDDQNEVSKNISEFETYEEIVKMIQRGFSIDDDNNNLNNSNLEQLEPYRTEHGVVISATRAAEIIYQYCATLGYGQLCPPRMLISRTNHGTFRSILSMPANCPIPDDIFCENKSKKLAKFQCCLNMVKLLHQKGELNDDCLPHHVNLSDESIEKKSDDIIEEFSKQIATFPASTTDTSNIWYLYRIDIGCEINQLGFVVPSKLLDLPTFNLYAANNEIITVKIVYIQPIDYTKYKSDLEHFDRYLFEKVFDEMTNDQESLLQFDIEQSTFKLLPCLIKNMYEIDNERMLSICSRFNKSVDNYSQLSNEELYIARHLSHKRFFMEITESISTKRTSNLWEHKSNSQMIKTYGDYFQDKVPNIHIHQDSLMAQMKDISKSRINYLYPSFSDTKNSLTTSTTQSFYFPIELLCYAPLNINDLQLFQKLPSILVRITQLYYIEQLRILFATHLNSYSIMISIPVSVSFTDCLKTMNATILPLTTLTFNSVTISNECTNLQPLSDILFQSVTRRSTGEQMDNENLEILGDCFLKLAVSMSLYVRYSSAGAGLLTIKKKHEISNKNLYRLSIQNKLNEYLNVKKIDFRGKDANWLPPGYKINKIQYTHQKAKRKAFSDMIEAFIGAFLIATDYTVTLKFMHWLGLDVIPIDNQDHIIKIPSIFRVKTFNFSNDQTNRLSNIFYVKRAFEEIEIKIKYKFENKAYLIAAFTHPSNFANRLTDCYERLEFIGDAILDFLVTRHIFVNYNATNTPGRVTDIRQDLANNGRLAYILVACGLHTKILHNSTDLFGHISSYAGDEDLFPKDQTTDQYLNKDVDQWANTTAPKALADVFEALVGAIFLDSNNSLEVVWNVFEPLLHNYINQTIRHPNLNPIRVFTERGGEVIKTSDLHFAITDNEHDDLNYLPTYRITKLSIDRIKQLDIRHFPNIRSLEWINLSDTQLRQIFSSINLFRLNHLSVYNIS